MTKSNTTEEKVSNHHIVIQNKDTMNIAIQPHQALFLSLVMGTAFLYCFDNGCRVTNTKLQSCFWQTSKYEKGIKNTKNNGRITLLPSSPASGSAKPHWHYYTDTLSLSFSYNGTLEKQCLECHSVRPSRHPRPCPNTLESIP